MPVRRAGWRERQPPDVPFGVNWRSPQANGLLGWWPLHGSRGTGVAIERVYGRAHTITPPSTGAMWVADPEMGSALRFDGAATEIVLSNVPKPSMPVTMCFWCWPNTSTQRGLYDTGPSTADTWRQYGNGEVEWHNNSPAVSDIWTGSSQQWFHIAVGYWHDGTNRNLRLWRNGVLITTGSVGANSTYSWTTPRIGTINAGADRFTGYLADFRFYDRLLSNADVAHLYDPATRWDLYRPLLRASSGKSAGPPAYITQIGVEALLDPMAEPVARITQLGMEVLAQTAAPTNAQITQVVLEVLGAPAALLSPDVHITQVVLEVIGSLSVPSPGDTASTPSDETANHLIHLVSWPR